MFRPAGAIVYETKDGQQTVAATASMGLLHWYMRSLTKATDITEPLPVLEVVQVAREIPGPYDPNFFIVVIACIERKFGTSPEISSDFYHEGWYDDLPEGLNDHKFVVQELRNSQPKVVAYEETCLSIFDWLTKHGDIVKFEGS